MGKYFLILSTISLLTSCNFKRQEADLVIYNAIIYTMDEGNSVQEAIAIKDGKILALGKDRDILNNFRYTESIDARKQFIYPGFIDAHCHFVNYGLGLQNADLRGTSSFSEVLSRLKKFGATHPKGQWIVGRGWDHTDWPGKQWPSKDSLDLLFPDTPILLHRIDGHAALVNSAALKAAGFTAATKINGGFLEVINGQLTGLIKENTVDSLTKFIPKPSADQLEKALKQAQSNCFAVGLTTVDDAGLDKNTLLTLKKLTEANKLDMRIYAMASDNPENFEYFSKRGPIKNPHLNVSSFKFYADGSLGSRSACMQHPYHDAPGEFGIMTTSSADLEAKMNRVYGMRFQSNTHAIGDSANREVLKIYGRILQQSNDKRWRIEHAQVVSKSDLLLFQQYTIIPSVQPTHATSDSKWAADRLGSDRIDEAYAYKQLLKQNGIIALGTDFPVEEIDPLATFYSAVFRKTQKGEPKNGFLMNNALSRLETLKAMTIWPALSNFEENEKGSLEKGKYADLVFLNKDILQAAEKDVLTTKVVRTVVGGKTVFVQ